MNSMEFKRWLSKMGCTFEPKRSGSGHIIIRLGNKKSELPMHGSSVELKKGLVEGIKKQLGLK